MATTVKSEMTRTSIRKQGIEFVNSIKSFLSIEEYVSAMRNATNLYVSDEGQQSIPEAVLGVERSNQIQARNQRQMLRDTALTAEMPEILRRALLQELADGCADEEINTAWIEEQIFAATAVTAPEKKE